ncbi:MAG: hypothetical protein ACK2T0_10175, partial [Anaerolineales bacterium]
PDDEAWFCTQDGTKEEPGLNAATLGTLFAQVRAERVLVIVDCCHAQRVLSTCRFFDHLEGSIARIYICSSDGPERSWEDKRARHGVFTAVLLSLLARRPADGWAGVMVQQRLVPLLQSAVPTAVATLKGVPQQPVTGGLARDDIVLPNASTPATWHPPTTLQALRRRFAVVLRRIAIVTCVGVLLVQAMTYHIGVNRAGGVGVATGVPWLRSLWPVGLLDRVDLGITVTELRTDPAARWTVSRGRAWGMWLHRDQEGERLWLNSILQLVNDRAASRLRVLALGEVPRLESGEVVDIQPWQILDVADAAMLTHVPAPVDLQDLFPAAPMTFEDLDYDILDRSNQGVLTLIEAAASLAGSSPEQGAVALERMRRAVAYRLAQETLPFDDLMAEVEWMCDAYARVLDRGGYDPLLLVGPLAAIEAKYASDRLMGAVICAHAGAMLSTDQRAKVESLLLDTLESFSVDVQGHAFTNSQHLALRGLLALFRTMPPSEVALRRLASITGEGNSFEQIPALGEFLCEVARWQPIPEGLWTQLLERATAPEGQFDFFALTAMRAVAANLKFVPSSERTRFTDAILRTGDHHWREGDRVMPAYALVMADLVAAGVHVPGFLPLMQEHLDATWSVPHASPEYEVLGALVEWSDTPYAVAIAVAYRHAGASNDVIQRLRIVALLRPNEPGRDRLVAFLANHEYASTQSQLAEQIRSRLAAYPKSAEQRALEIAIASQRLIDIPATNRYATISELRDLWRTESEPEVRQALGELILSAW